MKQRILLCSAAMALASCGGGHSSVSGAIIVTPTPPIVTPTPAPTPTPTPLPPAPTSSDRVLADLLTVTKWSGEWSGAQAYVKGDVVRDAGSLWLCVVSLAASSATASSDGKHFVQIPLVETGETTLVDDNFSGNGPLSGRLAGGGARWDVSGSGYQSAHTADGYLSAAGNAYFILSGFPGQVTEFDSYVVNDRETERLDTTSLSSANAANIFSSMYHINWSGDVLGAAMVWYKDLAGVFVNQRFEWYRTGPGIARGVQEKLAMRVRGQFVYGYLNDALVFVHVNELASVTAGAAVSLYIQNHSDTFGVERQARVVVRGIAH